MIAMTRILILGANGQLARHTLPYLLAHPDIQLTLYLRRAQRLANPDPSRATIIEGDVMDSTTLQMAMRDQDLVYANLTGDMAAQATKVIDSMKVSGLRRLIFISSMGIYGEVPGERYRSVLDPYRDSAALIEASDLDYTILRPGWFNRDKTENYQLTRKGEPFIGHAVSLNSLSSLITRLAMTPGMEIRQSLGVSTP